MMKKHLLGLMLASAAATMSPAAFAADATEAARALLTGANAAVATGTSDDATPATERAQSIVSGRHATPSASARGVDSTADARSAEERARALLSHGSPAPTRAEVLADVERARSNGSWRCLTNNRGWCGVIGL